MQNLLELCRRLEQRIAILEAEIEILRAENKALKIENAELKEKLWLNSKNSSLPSSRDLYKLKKEKPKSDRNIGGQPGHQGITRQKMEADEIIKVNLLELTCSCGGAISVLAKPYIHQKIDIPEIKPIVTEYHLQHGRCRKCGKRKSSSLPQSVGTDSFGPRLKSVISALSGFYKNSKAEIASIVKDIFNVGIAISSVSNSEARVAAKCEEAYTTIEQRLSNSKILHIDETSHYNKGKLGWCWMFTSNDASLLKLAESRGMKVLEASAFGSDDNIIVTDRYGAYNYFNEEHRQICWSHLARDFERFANSWHISVKTVGVYLSQLAVEVFCLKKSLLKNEIDILVFLREARKLRERSYYYLNEISNIADATGARRVAKNIIKSEKMMWKFLDDPINIPLTNNHAERQIRHYVIYRKNSYFTQSERGNIFLERIISLYLTWKQQGQNPFQNLLALVA